MKLGIRWTIGDVSQRGFEALGLSILGAQQIFADDAQYVVCVNGLDAGEAKCRIGELPGQVRWIQSEGRVPRFLADFFDDRMAEGVGWKFAPLRVFPDCLELSLDNDCILWEIPPSVARWLEDESRCLFAADVRRCLGQFEAFCGAAPMNSGIRGLPPKFDFEAALKQVLAMTNQRQGHRPVMKSELDEQGLQAAAVWLRGEPLIVTTDEVSICSPFYPHCPEPGRYGAHFVGLNARHIPWDYYDRPADTWMAHHWERHLPALREKVGLSKEKSHARVAAGA